MREVATCTEQSGRGRAYKIHVSCLRQCEEGSWLCPTQGPPVRG